MEPWQSWALVLAVGGGAYYYYNHHEKSTRGRTGRVATSETTTRSNRKRDNKPNVDAANSDANTSGTERGRQRRAREKPTKQNVQSPTVIPAAGNNTETSKGEEEDDKAFAQRMAGVKVGDTLAPPVHQGGRTKTVKQSSAAEPMVSSTSSTTGGDADDDLSPAVSPSLAATRGDISDMLPPAAAGPSVLKLTESKPNQTQRPKKAQQIREVETETKKQRQNRRKNEEKRLLREQEEKERKILEERQRRTAREARGEPAKNGMGSSKAPTSNAWSAPVQSANASTGAVQPAAGNGAPLLDTFEHDRVSTSSSTGPATSGTSATTSGDYYLDDLPSEEEQIRQFQQEDAWETVGKKGRKGKKNPGNSTTGEATGNESSDAGVVERKENVPVAPAAPVTVTNGAAYSTSNEAAVHYTGRHPQDSDWAVV